MEISLISPSQQQKPNYISTPPQDLNSSDVFNMSSSKVSPSILLVIIILAIIFFVSGLLHLLIRFFATASPPSSNRDPNDFDNNNVTAIQGQLQQLFNLHDSGVDQSFIDTLPLFNYKSIIGLKDPFDCAVCLCEFESEDKLRLLPKCSHAFHMECIDTWLLTHSTCPLCRACLLPSDFSVNNCCSPIVLVLESAGDDSREIGFDRESNSTNNSQLGSSSLSVNVSHNSYDNDYVDSREKVVVHVKLGNFRKSGNGESSSKSIVDARRCYSMGSFEYVMDENSLLQVPIRTLMKKQSSMKPLNLPLTPGHRPALSECNCESGRVFQGFDGIRSIEAHSDVGIGSNNTNSTIGRSKRESFSVSKIWLRGNKKDKQNTSDDQDRSKRAFSFRFPGNQNIATDDDSKAKNAIDNARRVNSEMGIARTGNGSRELTCEEQNQSCNILESEAKTPSFARKTLLWLANRQNKVLHSSFTPNSIV